MKETGEMKFGKGKLVLTAVLLVLALMPQSLRVAGQAGRKPPPPPESPTKADTPSGFVLDPNRDEYKIIFPSGYGQRVRFTTGERARKQDAENGWEDYEDSFLDQLNDAAARGYRLVSTALYPKVAIVRRDQMPHEYAIFETISPYYFSDAEFERSYSPFARKGFRVNECFYLWGGCDTEFGSSIERCEYRRVFVLERDEQEKTNKAGAYEILRPKLSFNAKKIESELTEQINSAGRRGLMPTNTLTRYEVLMQSPIRKGNMLPDEFEIQVAAGNLKKRVDELARQGYRLMIRPFELDLSVMYRKKGSTAAASYIWIREKRLEQELPRLEEQGAIYRTTYGCHGLWNGTMIFEQPGVTNGNRREYKVLTVELQRVENVAQQKVEFQLTPASRETVQILNRLAKEGFEVRDLFSCDMADYEKKGLSRVKILLERVK